MIYRFNVGNLTMFKQYEPADLKAGETSKEEEIVFDSLDDLNDACDAIVAQLEGDISNYERQYDSAIARSNNINAVKNEAEAQKADIEARTSV